MDFAIDITFNKKFLHAVVTGKNSAKSVTQYLDAVRRSTEEHACKKILIEDRLTGSGLDTFDAFDIVRSYARYARDHKLQIAYIDLDKSHHRTTVSFGENLANMLGVNVKVFESVDSATTWLIQKKS